MLGIPRNKSKGISDSSSVSLHVGTDQGVNFMVRYKIMLRSANAASRALDVSGEGGIGKPKGMTILISQSLRTPLFSR
jgi:hypothetical protein